MRAFILGNSGELLDHDLTRLNGEAVFGVNALPLRVPEIITHYVCLDIGMAFVPEVRALVSPTCKKYYSRLMWNTIYQEDGVNVYDCYPDKAGGFNISDTYVHGGLTVTYVALQIAAYLGYNPIYIMGVECGLPANGISHIPEQEVLLGMIRNKNLSDVTIDKRGMGIPETLVNGLTSTERKTRLNFILARDILKANGIEVYNLSKGGNLNAFPRKVYEEVVTEKDYITYLNSAEILKSNHETEIVSDVELSSN